MAEPEMPEDEAVDVSTDGQELSKAAMKRAKQKAKKLEAAAAAAAESEAAAAAVPAAAEPEAAAAAASTPAGAASASRSAGAFDASYWADTFGDIVKLGKRWSAEQAKSEAIFTALLEFHGRLKLLEPDACEGAAALGDSLKPLHARHVRSVENLLAALRASWHRFEALHAELADLHASVWKRHDTVLAESNADASALSESAWSVVGAGRGLDAQPVGLPPPLVCIEWVRELDAQYASELLLKIELLDGIVFGMSVDALQGSHRLWTLQPHLCQQSLDRAVMLVESLTLGVVSADSRSTGKR